MSPLTTASLIGAVASTASVSVATAIHHLAGMVLMPGYLGFTVVLLGTASWTVWGWSFARDRQNEREERRRARALVRRYGIDPDHVSMQSLHSEKDAVVLYPDFGRHKVDYVGERRHA